MPCLRSYSWLEAIRRGMMTDGSSSPSLCFSDAANGRSALPTSETFSECLRGSFFAKLDLFFGYFMLRTDMRSSDAELVPLRDFLPSGPANVATFMFCSEFSCLCLTWRYWPVDAYWLRYFLFLLICNVDLLRFKSATLFVGSMNAELKDGLLYSYFEL